MEPERRLGPAHGRAGCISSWSTRFQLCWSSSKRNIHPAKVDGSPGPGRGRSLDNIAIKNRDGSIVVYAKTIPHKIEKMLNQFRRLNPILRHINPPDVMMFITAVSSTFLALHFMFPTVRNFTAGLLALVIGSLAAIISVWNNIHFSRERKLEGFDQKWKDIRDQRQSEGI